MLLVGAGCAGGLNVSCENSVFVLRNEGTKTKARNKQHAMVTLVEMGANVTSVMFEGEIAKLGTQCDMMVRHSGSV